MERYNIKEVEKKWQAKWSKDKTDAVIFERDYNKNKKKFKRSEIK